MNKQLIAVSRTILSLLPLAAIAQPDFELGKLEEVTPNAYHTWDVTYEGEMLEIVSEYNNAIVHTLPIWTVVSSEYMELNKTRFSAGTCTDYIASRRSELFVDPDSGSRLIHGNAKDRLTQAQRLGISYGKDPQVGAIAVFKPGKGALSLGHVAYVEYVGDNGMIIISDMNFKEKNVVTHRLIPAHTPIGYIY